MENWKSETGNYSVFPTILSVDVGAELDQAFGDVDPAMEGSDVERGAVVVVSGFDKGGIFLKKLPHRRGVVLVGVPENQRGAAHPRLLILTVAAAAAAAAGTHIG